jgi:hypothetical protein
MDREIVAEYEDGKRVLKEFCLVCVIYNSEEEASIYLM